MLREFARQGAEIYEIFPLKGGDAIGRKARTGVFHNRLELRRTSISPADGTHDRTQGCDSADHGEHEQSHHQEECGPYIMEDDMVHRNSPPLLIRFLSTLPATTTEPAGHRINLGQPAATTGAVPRPYLPSATVAASVRRPIGMSHHMLSIE